MDRLVDCFDPSKKTLLIFGTKRSALDADICVKGGGFGCRGEQHFITGRCADFLRRESGYCRERILGIGEGEIHTPDGRHRL